jgi:tRNA(Ile)-lysidine synthase
LKKHRAIQSAVVRRAYILVAGGEQNLFFSHIEAVLRLAHDPASGKELHLPGRIKVTKRYDRLEFHSAVPEEAPPEFASILINCPGQTPLPLLKRELLAELRRVEASKIADLRQSPQPNEEWLDYDKIQPPLLVRGRREGDRFHPLGAPGAKSVSDFLSDEKIDPQTRTRTGVLCDQQGPIWIMPLRIDERVKLSPATQRALHLILRPFGQRAVD